MKFKIGASVIGFFLVLLLMFAVMMTVRIPNGYVGVVYSPNGGVQEQTLGQGWRMVGLFDKVIKYPIRMQTVEYKDIEVATSDGKNVKMDFAFNYSIQPDKVVPVFNKFGPVKVSEIEDSYLRTRLWDAGRKGIAKFSVIDTYGEKSADAAADVQKRFSEDIGKLGFIVENLTIGVPKPDAATQQAIDARVQKAQELERMETELQIAKKEAEKKREEARGNADKAFIEAEGRSKANKLLQQSITDELIQYEWVKKWNGQQPYVSGGNTITNLPTELFPNNK